MKKVDMVIDLQYGSTGKGLICGYLAEKHGYDVVINANMPNAGHTYIDDAGRKWMHKVLPNGIVSPKLRYAMLGAGSVFSLDQLRKEMEGSKDLINLAMLKIHENAVVLKPEHTTAEQTGITGIGSTQQGSAAALIEKMARNPEEPVLARELLVGTEFEQCLTTPFIWQYYLRDADHILAEGAQGYSLGINQQFYPFCTSRDCTPARFLAEMGIPVPMLNRVIGTARTYPIRVGGNSGSYYGDQTETTWDRLNLAKEYTTVTNRERRVFTFSLQQMEDALQECCPDEIFLNFCNYLDHEDVDEMVEEIESIGGHVQYLGWGAKRSDVEEVL